MSQNGCVFIDVSFLGTGKKVKVDPAVLELTNWESKYYVGYYKLPLARLTCCSADIKVRSQDPAAVARYAQMIIKDRTLNLNIRVVVRSAAFVQKFIVDQKAGLVLDVSAWLAEPGNALVKVEAFSGNHSLKAMQSVVKAYGEAALEVPLATYTPLVHVWALDDTSDHIGICKRLAMRVNTQEDERLKTNLLGHLELIHSERLRIIKEKGKIENVTNFCKSLASSLKKASSYVEKLWQLVRDVTEYKLIHALLVDAYKEYKAGGAGKGKSKQAFNQQKMLEDAEESRNPVPKMVNFNDFAPIIGLPDSERAPLLNLVYNRLLSVEDFKSRAARMKAIMGFTSKVTMTVNDILDTLSPEVQSRYKFVADFDEVSREYRWLNEPEFLDSWVSAVQKDPSALSSAELYSQIEERMMIDKVHFSLMFLIFLGTWKGG